MPENIQSLIWEDLVPDLVAGAILPRWWGGDSKRIHAVTLYQTSGRGDFAAAAKDEKLRQVVVNILSDRMLPHGLSKCRGIFRAGRWQDAVKRPPRLRLFYLTAEFRRSIPTDTGHWGPAGNELQNWPAAFRRRSVGSGCRRISAFLTRP